MRKLLLTLLFIVTCGVMFDALNYSTVAPPAGYSNAPGNTTCTGCHSGTALQTSGIIHNNITLTTTVPITSLMPSTTYTFDLSFSNAASIKYGFQLLVLPTGAIASTASLGTLTSTSTETEITIAGTRTYLSHSGTGTAAPSNTKTWSFDYTTPSTISSPPVFYVVINSSNNNGSSGGDIIYAKTFTSSILPVAWGNVNLKKVNNGLEINWQTKCEINNRIFDVENSADLVNWQTLGSVDAIGNCKVNQQYSYQLPALTNGKFFRIKQTDFDGKTSYSKIISISNGLQQSKKVAAVFIPNLNAYSLPDLGYENLLLFDVKGNNVITDIVNKSGSLQLNMAHLPMGIYLLQAKIGTEQFSWKLLKY